MTTVLVIYLTYRILSVVSRSIQTRPLDVSRMWSMRQLPIIPNTQTDGKVTTMFIRHGHFVRRITFFVADHVNVGCMEKIVIVYGCSFIWVLKVNSSSPNIFLDDAKIITEIGQKTKFSKNC